MKHSTSTPRVLLTKPRIFLLLGLLFCGLTPLAAQSQDFIAPGRGDDRACGFFPCPTADPQIEPNAGKWRTWLLSDGRQMRLPAPPPTSVSAQEIGVLKQLSFQRNAAALSLINYWDAGSPSLRWNEFAVEHVIKNNLVGPAASRVMSSLHVAIYDAMIAAWDSKYLHRRPRPSEIKRSD